MSVGKRTRRWLLGGAIVVLVILIALLCTCPSAEKHKAVLADEVSNAVTTVATESYGVLGAVGSVLLSGVVRAAVGELVSVDDYFLFSVGTVTFNGETTVVSVGVLNHIFTYHREVIAEQLRTLRDERPFD